MELSDYVSLREGRKKSEVETAREDGKMEAKIEIAKNALKNGLDIDTIVLLTGLDKETIENLSKN
jgi:predicted transposase/invertase (TIGR01784 family)